MNLSLAAESEAVGAVLSKDAHKAGRGSYRIRYKIVKFDFPPPFRGGRKRMSSRRGVYLRRLDGNAQSEPEGSVLFKTKNQLQAMIDKGFGVESPKGT